jgi:hypothetical protein
MVLILIFNMLTFIYQLVIHVLLRYPQWSIFSSALHFPLSSDEVGRGAVGSLMESSTWAARWHMERNFLSQARLPKPTSLSVP